MAQKIMNDYYDTKRMLNILRNIKVSSKRINEQDEHMSQSDDNNGVDVINDVNVKLISDDNLDLNLSDEQKKSLSGLIDGFRQQVSQTAELTPGFTFNTNEIRFDGTITDFEIKFTYIAGQSEGLYINAEMLNVTAESLVIIQKLLTFKQQIVDALNLMLRYRNNN